MRKLLLLMCILAAPCSSFAQSSTASWESLKAIPAGEKIQVREMNSKKISGTLVSVSDAAISLQGQSGAQTIQMHDVRSVKLMKHAHRLRNSLIGAGVGAGLGAAIGAGTSTNNNPCIGYCGKAIPVGFGAALGLLGGAVLGALWPDHKTIYRAAAR